MGEKHRKIAKEIEAKLKAVEARISDMRRGLEHDDCFVTSKAMKEMDLEVTEVRHLASKFDEE